MFRKGATITPPEWTRGTPKYFRSSNLLQRSFCGDCGTPLGCLDDDGMLELAVGAFGQLLTALFRQPFLQGADQRRHHVDDDLHALGFTPLGKSVDEIDRQRPGWCRGGVHQHERSNPSRVPERVALRDDAAHRVPEEIDALAAERVDKGGEVGDEMVERVARRVAGVLGLRVAPLVVANDASGLGKRRRDVVEVAATARVAVHQEQRHVARPFVEDLELNAVDLHGSLHGRGR